jgi:hypothetical protein
MKKYQLILSFTRRNKKPQIVKIISMDKVVDLTASDINPS